MSEQCLSPLITFALLTKIVDTFLAVSFPPWMVKSCTYNSGLSPQLSQEDLAGVFSRGGSRLNLQKYFPRLFTLATPLYTLTSSFAGDLLTFAHSINFLTLVLLNGALFDYMSASGKNHRRQMLNCPINRADLNRNLPFAYDKLVHCHKEVSVTSVCEDMF